MAEDKLSSPCKHGRREFNHLVLMFHMMRKIVPQPVKVIVYHTPFTPPP